MFFLFFNWIPFAILFALLAIRSRQAKGVSGLAIGSCMQLYAHWMYRHDWDRFAGHPDRLYVWITPTLICAMSVVILLSGIVLNYITAKEPQSNPRDIKP